MELKTEFSSPYVLEENGLAERSNRRIIEVTRSPLYTAKLSLKFWSYASRTAVFILNRLATSVTGSTPYQLLFKSPTDVSSLRVFGAPGFMLSSFAWKE